MCPRVFLLVTGCYLLAVESINSFVAEIFMKKIRFSKYYQKYKSNNLLSQIKKATCIII